MSIIQDIQIVGNIGVEVLQFFFFQVLKVLKHCVQNCDCDRMSSNLLNCVLR